MSTIQKNCAACGTLITVRLADHKRGWGKFCDKSCAAAYKCGQRPRDVNANHAKYSPWAAACLDTRDLTKAPAVEAQIGEKVKVKLVKRSYARQPWTGPGSARSLGHTGSWADYLDEVHPFSDEAFMP